LQHLLHFIKEHNVVDGLHSPYSSFALQTIFRSLGSATLILGKNDHLSCREKLSCTWF